MLQNAYFLAKIGADTAENEQHFAEILRIPRAPPRSCASSWSCLERTCTTPESRTLFSTCCRRSRNDPRSWRATSFYGLGLAKLGKSVKFCKFWAGSFSAVSKRNFARKYAFDSIFQALQDLHTFAPLQSQNFSKKSVWKISIFCENKPLSGPRRRAPRPDRGASERAVNVRSTQLQAN